MWTGRAQYASLSKHPAHTVEERAGQLEPQKAAGAPDAGEQARAAHGRFFERDPRVDIQVERRVGISPLRTHERHTKPN
jgi:hypothetical protein